MMSESLAEYSALRVMEKKYGSDNMRKFLSHELDGYLRGRSGEIRHENIIQGGVVEHAFFLGPTAFYQVAPKFSAKVAWAIQAPDLGAKSLDLVGFERHQAELQFVYGF